MQRMSLHFSLITRRLETCAQAAVETSVTRESTYSIEPGQNLGEPGVFLKSLLFAVCRIFFKPYLAGGRRTGVVACAKSGDLQDS
jgi:hypothetical protein